MNIARELLVTVLFSVFLFRPCFAAGEKASVDKSLFNEAKRSVEIGCDWLVSQQNAEGYWAQKEYPALSALAIKCLIFADRAGVNIKKYETAIEKGMKFLVLCVKKNGSICGENLSNYNTAICLTAFIARRDPKYDPIIVNANNYLVGLQADYGTKGVSDSSWDGGMGYDEDNHSDMPNTAIALEALYLAKKLAESEQKSMKPEQNTEKSVLLTMKQLDWKAAEKFLSRCQNLPGSNDQAWASGDSINNGGFIYYPGISKAGEMQLPNGKTALRSYGSMTYTGLLSFMFAKMDKNDPRVKAALEWLGKNYNLIENPGLGQDGLYYYYHMMAKALKLYGKSDLQLANGKKIDWRAELLNTFFRKQDGKGFWVNNAGRWWENDPVLCTTYSLQAIEMIVP
jgi:squalene-hopene/tetraprenyl-beta-curcumene cyclase